MDSPGAKQRVRKSAAIVVVFCVLCCGMFHLEYRLDQEAFRVAVVAAKREYFADDAAAWLPLDMDDEIDCFSDLRFGDEEGGLRLRITRLAKLCRAFSAEVAPPGSNLKSLRVVQN